VARATEPCKATPLSPAWTGRHFTPGQDDHPAFTGVITVLDQYGGQQTMANWPLPTDEDADTALGHTGWQRVGPWTSDYNGRRSALVLPTDRRAGVQAIVGADE
jgi:hypothetical protein